ncbi:MAG: HAD family phosphatase [Euryarchaeota archaeon]|nr:HAD family phosphatase [Euryarchaeota archaeon]
MEVRTDGGSPEGQARPGTRLRAVIFDFDGVLIDSMTQHWRAYHATLMPFGIDLPRDEIFRREGGRSTTIIRDILEKSGQRVSDAQVTMLAAEKNRLFRSYGAPRLSAGAEELVAFVKGRGVKVGLATGTTMENLRFLMPGTIHFFDAIYSADDKGPEKPDPAPYLETAKRLGVAPNECLVVENAPYGVQSALAAGCKTIAVATTVEPHALSGASSVYRNLQEVRAALEKLI